VRDLADRKSKILAFDGELEFWNQISFTVLTEAIFLQLDNMGVPSDVLDIDGNYLLSYFIGNRSRSLGINLLSVCQGNDSSKSQCFYFFPEGCCEVQGIYYLRGAVMHVEAPLCSVL